MQKFTFLLLPIAAALCCTSLLKAQNFTQPMYVPPLLEGILNGPQDRIYTLEPEEGLHRFTPNGFNYETAGYNGLGYLGPTIVWNKGDSVTMEVHNHLHHTTTVHWHGAHVPAFADGGPHDSIPHDSLWTPRFKILNEASTLWYHPHLHHHTLEQVNKGLAGMIIINDPNDPYQDKLPHTYGVDDFPIIVQDKDLTQDTINTTCTMGTTFLVNGDNNPVLEVPAQQVRFRILNAGSERVFALYFNDNTSFNIVATDAGYTAKPLPDNFTILSTGERVEWVADFTGRAGEELYLANLPSIMGPSLPGNPTPAVPGCYNNGMQNFVDSFPVNMLKIRIVAPTANPITILPTTFGALQIPDVNNVDVERFKKLVLYNPDQNAPPFTIDSTDFNIAVINDIVLLNDIETWEITNISTVAHPFHIHDISFFILSMIDITDPSAPDTLPIPNYLQGPKDVVLVPNNTKIKYITQFTDFAAPLDPFYGYMYHCHILAHEDGGMMHQFVVIDPSSTDEPLDKADDWALFPNPSNGALHLRGASAEDSRVYILNQLGQRVAQYRLPPMAEGQAATLTQNLPAGTYMVHWERQEGSTSKVWMVR